MKKGINTSKVPITLSKGAQNYSYNSALISKIKGLFNSGGKYTAKQLNGLCGFNDARKVISVLRTQGMAINDLRLENRCKLYWMEKDKIQLSLFDGEEGLNNG